MAMCSLVEMNVLARSYPGGIAALAQLLGKAPGTLRAELQPPVGSTAKLGWLDGLALMSCFRQVHMPTALTPLDIVEAEFGRLAVQLPAVDGVAAEGLLPHVSRLAKEFSDVLAEVSVTTADGQVNDRELAAFDAQAAELITAVQGMRSHLAKLNRDAKPAHLRAAA